jgi:hypothetical protein
MARRHSRAATSAPAPPAPRIRSRAGSRIPRSAVCSSVRGIPSRKGEFLLELADINPPADDALHLRGTVASDGQGRIILDADETAAQEFYEQVLRTKLDRPAADLSLRQLLVTVTKTEGDIGEANITVSADPVEGPRARCP